ncbi:ion transporter [Pararhizobium antarcticum]|uniref:Voltage-gated sodium channel n=1 Tax=Pararhizobium antarcticum TaxID=1798805 RepID=A0A657LP76_9HYPH|nr:ion transporter [Pararhizobium antarcticum]OJF92474.1 voltage-gated sodium channel [Pararhizobium antarcticum]OJF99670.1 voltage-gated sodium channel [Rhizobium sp. 58]
MTSRAAIAAFLDRPLITRFLIVVILINGITLGLETSSTLMNRIGPLLIAIDTLCLMIFVVELLAKLYAAGLRFFRSPWNVFDFIIVGISLIPAGTGFSVLRALRILRVLRVVSVAPSLRRVVDGLGRALPGMASVFVLISLIYYIGAVMATKLFGAGFPDWFGDLGNSAYSLFQVMTLESWSMGIVRPVMEVYPYAWAFFVPFILMTTFAVMNLIVGLIVNSMQEAASEETRGEAQAFETAVMARLDAIELKLDRKS